MLIVLAHRVTEQDAEAALLEFERMRASDSGIYITPALLDRLGLGLTRAGAGATALGLFERNQSAMCPEWTLLGFGVPWGIAPLLPCAEWWCRWSPRSDD